MNNSATGVVVAGHGVASGRAKDTPFAGGTLELQAPHFAARGLDLSPFVLGTINLNIAPSTLRRVAPRWTFADVTWTEVHGPETFSFVDCTVSHGGRTHVGLVYIPHPETKPMHQQPGTVVELILPRLTDLSPGDAMTLWVDPTQAALTGQSGDL